ncbi:MAG TPA: GNAT family N-acetyltransferase [Actinomycetota bacterium]|nr:GNAT family N-acetyltransferase [Actinomycetota bacterium]
MSDALSRPIETDRLSLRPMRPADAEDLFAIMRDPAIGAAMHEPSPENVAVVRARIASWIRGPGSDADERWLNWIARTDDGRPVAHLAATIHGRVAWLAWVVGVEHQRRGYATEAARGVMDRLATNGIGAFAASIRDGHEASEGVARHLGLHVTDEIIAGERVWRTQEASLG